MTHEINERNQKIVDKWNEETRSKMTILKVLNESLFAMHGEFKGKYELFDVEIKADGKLRYKKW